MLSVFSILDAPSVDHLFPDVEVIENWLVYFSDLNPIVNV